MDGVVAVSDAVADELRRLHVTPEEKITVIPLGLNLQPFLEAAPSPRASCPAVGRRGTTSR